MGTHVYNSLNLIPNLNQQRFSALTDTGACVSSIDSDLAVSLGLQMHDKAPLSGIGGVHEIHSYAAQVYIPSFSHTILGSLVGVHLSGAPLSCYTRPIISITLQDGV